MAKFTRSIISVSKYNMHYMSFSYKDTGDDIFSNVCYVAFSRIPRISTVIIAREMYLFVEYIWLCVSINFLNTLNREQNSREISVYFI